MFKSCVSNGTKYMFNLQLDESTLPSNIRCFWRMLRYAAGGHLKKELLFACLMETDTKDALILKS